METNKRTTLLAMDLLNVPVTYRKHFMKLHDLFEKWILNEGNQGVKRTKEVFSFTLTFLLEGKSTLPLWLKKSTKVDGIPQILDDIWLWVIANPRQGLTLLRYSDLYVAVLDDEICREALKPIVGEDTRNGARQYDDVICAFAERLSVPKLKVEVGSVPMFTKGPNGISILSVHKDSIALSQEGILDPVLDLGNRIASITDGIELSNVITDIVREFSTTDKVDSSLFSGRVVFLPEKSGKVRVIAQGDYISQTMLKPIHDSLAGILGRLPGDWTFDQEGGKRWVQKKTTTAKWCASFDLSNATDRLPIDLQAKIIDRVLPGNLGALWHKVIQDRQFKFTLPSKRSGFVKYAVGQPMGFYSSFVSFALLHHCVVNVAFEIAHGRPGRDFYAIIGDDMVIFDKAAGSVYLDIINSIGGVINLTKSRVTTDRDNIIAEFAKAYFKNGVELTPFSLKEIRSALDNWANVPIMFNRLRRSLGEVIRAKKLKLILQEYWPNEANNLVRLLEVPEHLGGFGKPGHTPLAKVLRGHSNCFRRFLAYRALEAYKCVVDISADDIAKATNNIDDRTKLRLALTPFLGLLRDRQAEIGIPSVVTSRRGFLDWALSDDVPLSSLVRCVTLMTKDLPTSLREKVRRPSVLWVRALADDKRSSSVAQDSDNAYFYAYQELVTSA